MSATALFSLDLPSRGLSMCGVAVCQDDGELTASLGIDVSLRRHAPRGEILRIHWHALDLHRTVTLELLNQALRVAMPDRSEAT